VRSLWFYVVDESSLASTRQVNDFLHRLQDQDRVIFVGDTRQHQGVEAGRPFQQLQEPECTRRTWTKSSSRRTRDEHIANRELGTVDRIDSEGNLQIRLDSGRDAQFNIREHPHLDYGYSVTSDSSQGATADRVLVHVDTEQAHEKPLTRGWPMCRFRAAATMRRFTPTTRRSWVTKLSREVSKRSWLQLEESSGQSRGDGQEDEGALVRS
jgi:ATP-dependent exoDNAse (exonuclease V) alpha subunit